MSVKAMGLVWDIECPKEYNGVAFRPSHKFTLLAYADHADHQGKNIWPSVRTISQKTGLDERSVQRLTNDLEVMGFLIDDGQGPKGTNKWCLPIDTGGGRLSPLALCRGDKKQESLGDIPSGDIPSGDTVPPELKEPEPLKMNLEETPEEKIWKMVVDQLQREMPKATFETYVRDARAVRYDGNILSVKIHNAYARDWLESRLASTVNRLLIGILNNAEVTVQFMVSQAEAQ